MGTHRLTKPNQTPNTCENYPGVTQWVLTSIVEREKTLTNS